MKMIDPIIDNRPDFCEIRDSIFYFNIFFIISYKFYLNIIENINVIEKKKKIFGIF